MKGRHAYPSTRGERWRYSRTALWCHGIWAALNRRVDRLVVGPPVWEAKEKR